MNAAQIESMLTARNKLRAVELYIESADADDLRHLIATMQDRLDEVDPVGTKPVWDALEEAYKLLSKYANDPRHDNGCGCASCNEARTERRDQMVSDALDRMLDRRAQIVSNALDKVFA